MKAMVIDGETVTVSRVRCRQSKTRGFIRLTYLLTRFRCKPWHIVFCVRRSMSLKQSVAFVLADYYSKGRQSF